MSAIPYNNITYNIPNFIALHHKLITYMLRYSCFIQLQFLVKSLVKMVCSCAANFDSFSNISV